MRVLQYGAELGTPAEEGWTVDSGTWIHTATPHQHTSGFGGAKSARPTVSGRIVSPAFATPLVEFWAIVSVRNDANIGDFWEVLFHNSGTDEVVSVGLDGSDQVEIRVAGVGVAQSSEVLADASFYTLGIHVRIHDTLGLVEVFLDDEVDTPIVTYSGDTLPGAFSDVDGVWLDGFQSNFDDLKVNAITLAYDGGSGGVPAAGETITGAASGATAVITAVDGDATSGRLFLRSVSGTFQNNEQITSSGTADALVNGAAGLEKNSGQMSPFSYIKMLTPNDDNSPGMTPVGEVTNYEAVDDWASGSASDANYVETGTPNTFDMYELSALGSGLTAIDAVQVVVRARKQGVTITQIEPGLKVGGTEYFADVQALGSSYALHGDLWETNPDTAADWVEGDFGAALQAGFRVT